MKLILCKKCGDIVALRTFPRSCSCGVSGGQYTDSLNAVIWGRAIPLGFHNASFLEALRNRPKAGLGSRFEAFVIPEKCSTIRVVSNGEGETTTNGEEEKKKS